MGDANPHIAEESSNSAEGMSPRLSDAPLLDLLDALMKGRGKVLRQRLCELDYRTLPACHDFICHVSRRMRRALEEYRGRGDC